MANRRTARICRNLGSGSTGDYGKSANHRDLSQPSRDVIGWGEAKGKGLRDSV